MAAGVGSFVRAEGDGDPVVLMHGLPSSSFLYRKVIRELATRGLRALSFDLPGLGFADRPPDFDYTFTGLGRFAVAAVEALGLERFHLVVHDAGGPVGFELASAIPERVRSLTLLNTVVDMNTVPFPMEIYARFATGDRWPALPPAFITRELLYRIGIRNRAAVPPQEVDVYRRLVLRDDNGRAYLQIMRNLERTPEKARLYASVVDTRTGLLSRSDPLGRRRPDSLVAQARLAGAGGRGCPWHHDHARGSTSCRRTWPPRSQLLSQTSSRLRRFTPCCSGGGCRGRISGLRRAASLAGLAALVVLAAAGCGGNESKQSVSGPVCGYYYEWKSAWKFALQPDPHAAYTYVIPKVTTDPIGFVISGPFPYAAWTSWTIYNAQAQPFSLAKDSAITPDAGSVNPFVVGTPVLSPKRNFTLLVLPEGTDTSTIDESLRDIPASNIISSPTSGKGFIIANRVYNAFPGYNRGGAAGPTKTAVPDRQGRELPDRRGRRLRANRTSFRTRSRRRTCPRTRDVRSPGPAVAPADRRHRRSRSAHRGAARAPQGDDAAVAGAEYAPALDPTEIEFTRPPLLPGADVSSIPPPDNCAGYLGAATSTSQIGLIRMPHVAQWFDTSHLTPQTPFEQEQTTYISFTQYGSGDLLLRPGQPEHAAASANGELKVDSSGGIDDPRLAAEPHVGPAEAGVRLREDERLGGHARRRRRARSRRRTSSSGSRAPLRPTAAATRRRPSVRACPATSTTTPPRRGRR